MTKEISIEPGGLIGLCGYKGAGKSHTAQRLAQQVRREGRFEIAQYAFAEPMKDVLSLLLQHIGFDEYDAKDMFLDSDLKDRPDPGLWGHTPRHLMVTFGTEWGRNLIDPNMWVDITMRKVRLSLERREAVVVDDVRFESEATAIRKAGGKVILVQRPGVERRSDHVSEQLPPYDDIYDNWEKPDDD